MEKKVIKIVCGDCGNPFSYVKTANVVKKFCDTCCARHNVKSKRRNYLSMLQPVTREEKMRRAAEIEDFLKKPPQASPVLISNFIDNLQRFA
jgi:hypothetical protein